MQGFYPAVHHLREPGVVGDFRNGNAVFFQEAERASGGEQFDAAVGKGAAELDDAGFITNADECATDGGISLVCHGVTFFTWGERTRASRRVSGRPSSSQGVSIIAVRTA